MILHCLQLVFEGRGSNSSDPFQDIVFLLLNIIPILLDVMFLHFDRVKKKKRTTIDWFTFLI